MNVIAEATDSAIVVEAVTERIENDSSEKVRLVALGVLPQVARKGNLFAISACVSCLARDSDKIREAAWEAIARLATKGCNVVISACLASLDDENAEVACAAAQLLGRVAPEGHVASVGCLAVALQSRSRRKTIDRAILHSLSHVVTRGNHTAVCATMQFIASSVAHEEQARTERLEWHETFEALREMAAKDDVVVISFIASYLGSNVRGIREHAALSLSTMLEGITIDTSSAWLAAARTELCGSFSRPMEQGELTHAILKELLQAQGWLPCRRLRQKSRIVPRYVEV